MDQTEAPAKTQAHARYNHRKDPAPSGGRESLHKARRMPGSPTSRAIKPNKTMVVGSSAMCRSLNRVAPLSYHGYERFGVVAGISRTWGHFPFTFPFKPSKKAGRWRQERARAASTMTRLVVSVWLPRSPVGIHSSASLEDASRRDLIVHRPGGLFRAEWWRFALT
jgi:hypothetical protein